jgi:hypothetical protein
MNELKRRIVQASFVELVVAVRLFCHNYPVLNVLPLQERVQVHEEISQIRLSPQKRNDYDSQLVLRLNKQIQLRQVYERPYLLIHSLYKNVYMSIDLEIVVVLFDTVFDKIQSFDMIFYHDSVCFVLVRKGVS